MSEPISEAPADPLVETPADDEGLTVLGGAGRKPRRVREIDFARPTKFTQDQQRRIERAHEAFCRAAGTQLSAELRHEIEFELVSVTQVTLSTTLAELPQPSIFGIVETQPLGTKIVVYAEQPAVMRLIERLLGGVGGGEPPERELTEIEIALTKRVFGTILGQLSMTWEELFGLRLGLVELESQSANIHLAPSTEPTLVVNLRARTEGSESTVALVIPYLAIEAVVDRLPTGQYGQAALPTPEQAAALRASLAGVDVELRAEVAAVELTIDQVLALRPGDVLPLGVPAAAGITLCADATPIHRCKPGRSGNRRAVEVLERLEGAE